MTNGRSAGVLLDTNVLLYGYDPAEHSKQQRAIAVLERVETYRLGALSAQVLGECFNSVTRKLTAPLSPAEAEQRVVNSARSWPVFDLTALTVMEAVRGAQRYQLSYWDALIWATAKLNGVPNVLSEDFNDGAVLEGVRFLNPFSERFDLAQIRGT